jgi:hypothetical protein
MPTSISCNCTKRYRLETYRSYWIKYKCKIIDSYTIDKHRKWTSPLRSYLTYFIEWEKSKINYLIKVKDWRVIIILWKKQESKYWFNVWAFKKWIGSIEATEWEP